MAGESWIWAYYQDIKDGSVVVGRWIRLLYEYIVRGLEEKLFFYDAKKANSAIEWIESHCFHTEGPLAPGPFILELWQKALISCMFGIVDEKGLRQFREVVLIVARKNGKSLFASAIARYIWTQEGFGTKVFTTAPKLEQAAIIYDNIWVMTQLDPEWQQKNDIARAREKHQRRDDDVSDMERHRQTDLYIPASNSTVKKIAFAAKRSDGFNPSLCICDEIAAWEGDKGLKQYEVLKSGMGARPEAMLLSCSTSGYISDSIYDEILKRSTAFLLGNSKERKLLPVLYMIDDIEKWNDINELRKSNPNLGVSVSVDYLIEEIAVAEASLSKKAEFITKYCNLKQNSSLAWLPANVIERACGDPLRLEDFAKHYGLVGIDLSQTVDLTAAVLVIEKNGEFYVFAHFWLPAEKIDEAKQRDGLPYDSYVQRGFLSLSGDNFVDYRDCFNWCCELVRKYKIYPLMAGYDRYSAQYLIKDLENFGYKTDSVYQGDNLWPIIQFTEGVLKDGKLHIGDNDLLKVHLLNSAVKMSVERGRGKLIKLNATDHIDGTAALLDAMTVRAAHYDEFGQRLKNEGK
jgi:phage terminase large subunit-like protein